MAIMRLTSAWVTGVAGLGLAVVLLGCAVPPGNGATPDKIIENYQERFPLAPIPRSEGMEQDLVDLMRLRQTDDAVSTLALYSDPADSAGLARVCVTPAGVDLCEPPVDQTKRFVTEIDGFDVYLFSGPDDVGYRSPFADKVRAVAWRVDAP